MSRKCTSCGEVPSRWLKRLAWLGFVLLRELAGAFKPVYRKADDFVPADYESEAGIRAELNRLSEPSPSLMGHVFPKYSNNVPNQTLVSLFPTEDARK